MKEDGHIILSVPICWEHPTFEDEKIIDAPDRVRYYGQEDHVRMYGNDFGMRLEKSGFQVRKCKVDEVKYEKLKKLGLILYDAIWILTKC